MRSAAHLIETQSDIARGLRQLAEADPRLVPVIAQAGPLPLRRKPAGFASLAEIILSQMVSKASAAALQAKLEARLGNITPEGVLSLNDEAARAVGLSRAKAETLRRIAESLVLAEAPERLDLDHLCECPVNEAMALMTAIKGVGPWTAEVYLLFCAGHRDVFPSGDIALQSAAQHALGLENRPSARQLARTAESWAPWRGVAARLLWAYYATAMKRDATPLGA
ncbi:DNA-3-methyladenine glycosylase 2 family protein [Pseudohoeflea suaedae]|uniref:DNA-3-methyladenine glycosylase II n=1 Tax=Pseudohoeflea suaedae TaxID=877384 RepID=A0A4R5PHZ5_9HYPH|nr:DNA-3-methyladenine glycosylase [Pseudohoeflea suaedae]TDH34845.1 DNA-3-methyladenine glycosylase 2 family protein [Pseudohoeflea suaedae]